MKLVTYNIQYSKGRDGRFDLARVVGAVAGADVIALQEVERFWPRTGMTDQPAEIAAMLPGYYWVYRPPFDMDASVSGGDGAINNRRRQFGNMLLATTPIIASRLHLLPRIGSASQFNMTCGALEGVMMTGAGPLRVYSVHLAHLSSLERVEQVEALLAIHRRVAVEGGAWSGDPALRGDDWTLGEDPPPAPAEAVLLGDFNFEPSGPEYPVLVGPEDPAYGRTNYSDRFVDAWVAAGNGDTSCVTFPRNEKFADLCLDYCFLTPGLARRVREAWVDAEAEGSDHQPVWVELDA